MHLALERIAPESEADMSLMKRSDWTRWDPFRELEEISTRLGRIFPRGEGELSGMPDWTPRVNLRETPEHYEFVAELPQVKKDDVRVTLEGNALTIAGEKKMEKEEKGAKYHRIETSYGSFMRTFTLPEDADTNKILAEHKDGTLFVKVARTPGAHKTTGKTIPVK